jgi:dTDP-4-dehydrorhamnose 3,5-epimerase-like enzyme
MDHSLWKGVRPEARDQLTRRDYSRSDLASDLSGGGVEAGRLIEAEENLKEVWIPGVEIFRRTVHPQRHRGFFGEFVRQDEGVLGKIGLWPRQWATATMFAGSCKGFHIHPPHIPEGENPASYLAELYGEKADPLLRPYAHEQWDIMFFVRGVAEMFLVDEREGMPRRRMRLHIDGDNHRGGNNVGVVIPPGVAHAIRAEGSEDLVMVYGTSTKFHPENEGRIASGVEIAPWPEGWQQYWENA